jgi:hypothetical protein
MLQIIQLIKELPLNEQLQLMEETLKSIQQEQFNKNLMFAVEEMQEEYHSNKELTAFSALDLEEFYEAK